MKVFAVNGGPRKNHNTDSLLKAFLEGAASAGEEVEVKLIDLYDLNFKGCTECFGCKVRNSESYGKCCYTDEATEILREITYADVIAFGSPVYFSDITGQLRCFLERLFYPLTAFKKDSERVIAPKQIKTAFFHTMNVKEEIAELAGYKNTLAGVHNWTAHIFGVKPEVSYIYDIYQLENHEKFEFDIWDWDAKKARHLEHFPVELQKSYELGYRLAKNTL